MRKIAAVLDLGMRRARGLHWAAILTVILLAASPLPAASQGRTLEPIPVIWDAPDAQLWYLGAMNQEVASKRLSRYRADKDMGVELGEALRHFNYVISDSFFEMMSREELLLVMTVQPRGRYWMFPARTAMLLTRGDDAWVTDRTFVVYYSAQSGTLAPWIQPLGGDYDVHLQLNDDLNTDTLLKHGGWESMSGRLHNWRHDGEITLYAVIAPLSDQGTRWNNQDRKTPISVLLVSTAEKEARHEEDALHPHAASADPALAGSGQPERER